MVSPDSDLFRAHPEWALATTEYEPVLGRHQLVLDLGRPEAFAAILARLDALLADHDIEFVKWDMNRDHVQAGGAEGRAGTHRQTTAVYALFDELRARHPHVEFESCASGGARIDHGILERAERVWTSDCNDALERQTIQRWATLFVPPEVLGAHIGPPVSHTTGRTHTLAFRAATALFGHLGIEWNLLEAADEERADVAAWVALYKRFRPLLHGGDVVRVDELGVEPFAHAHGVLAPDRGEALVAYVQLASAPTLAPPPLRVPELTPERTYRAALLASPGAPPDRLTRERLPILDGVTLTGRQLARHGIRLPVAPPESVTLVHVVAEPAP
jgi:alpha-galactosidase